MHSSGINVYKLGCHLHRNETLFFMFTDNHTEGGGGGGGGGCVQ